MGRGWSIVVVAALLVTANFGSERTTPARTVVPATPPAFDGTVQVTVQSVLDGRTVLLTDGTRIVIDGLAPAEECWAVAATAFSKALLQDKPVRIKHVDDAINAETPLWLQDGTEYALVVVDLGMLRGDAPHDPAYVAAEATAAKAGLGLWGAPCFGKR